MDIRDQKRVVRRTVLTKRAKIPDTARAAASSAVADRILSLPEIESANDVMAFASFGTEIPTQLLVQALLESSRRVLMPYVDGARLRAAVVRSLDDLAPGYRGIAEPTTPVAADPAPGTVLLVPGVAFDERGRRLGYGGGFYDSFLAAHPGFRIGVCFDCQIVDEVPSEPHDLPVSIVATEARTIRPEQAGA